MSEKYEIIDEMDKLIKDNYNAIKESITKNEISFKYFDSMNGMNVHKIKTEIDKLPSNGVVLFTQFLVSKVAESRKKYIVTFEDKNVTFMISVDK